MRAHLVVFGLALLAFSAGCTKDDSSLMEPNASAGGAAIIGSIVSRDGGSKVPMLGKDGDCPDAVIALNSVPVSVAFDEDCRFAITDIDPAEMLVLRVDVLDLGISGTVEIHDVLDGELIELEVDVTDERLSIDIIRRAPVLPSTSLPGMITGNNVEILIADGLFQQDLTVQGNNFVVVGEAGENCGDTGWSVIEGDIFVDGNNATFRNISFIGDVEIHGNNTSFINCCFNGELELFGRGRGSRGFDDDDDDEDDD